ncbi:neutral ceramidase precursor [Cordyceps fumosorosea ARSEF 2679]|uniref:Neutral ceramidase n=1 Tax=Cordyceps fumosorosea (strain ARSEF 2679) TaxID=1081104 RepID=A0A167SCC8_CORFA|nr:neutral ceramidase precursor [Cordyceps fumosorosea ARSEF 2679]OAA59485.1 neutral ceramidase precursor [Cordyceps fumosorosea ARSEF 2679]
MGVPEAPRKAPASTFRTILTIFSLVSVFIFGAYALGAPSDSHDRRAYSFAAAHFGHRTGFSPSPASPSASASASTSGRRDGYLIGVGKADITGPVVEINFAGYANLDQKGTGLRQRLFSRAFIIGDKSNPKDRFVYIVIDTQSGDTAVRYGVLDGVSALGSEYSVYGQQNIALTGTHSHSGPGAWFNYLLPQITSLGFDKQSYQAIVDGVVLSIKRAHESLQEGYIDVGSTKVSDGAINRSRWAYLNNPEEERARYDAETDTDLTLIRFQRASDSKNIGVLSWFPVHGTSMLGNNTHASGDNKGVAAWLLEEDMKNDKNTADGFVAGFSQANVGDTTPNVLGAWCDDGSGQQCSLENSTCADGKSESCHGRGPFFAALDLGVKSCFEMGRRQYAGAKSILDSLDSSGTAISGSTVKSFHFYNDMRYFNFTLPNGKQAQTCPAALGYSFAAGTSDWPGAFDFTQGDSGKPNANPIWKVVSGLLRVPSAAQKKCQEPKPILLDVGEMQEPYPWTPNIVDVQMLRVGQLVFIISPSEATTMSGRRWREAVAKEAASFVKDPVVVLGGPANSYSHYLATPEEYDIQRYEGASTLFGRNELPAYINLTVSNMHYLHPDATEQPAQGTLAPDNRGKMLSFITGVVVDGHPPGKNYGSVLRQPAGSATIGGAVNATFQGANPRNNLRQEDTFVAVERQTGNSTWTRYMDDNHWDLVYTWRRTNGLLGWSEVDVAWETQQGRAEPGTYRFKYYGDSKSVIGRITQFEGTSNSFTLS